MQCIYLNYYLVKICITVMGEQMLMLSLCFILTRCFLELHAEFWLFVENFFQFRRIIIIMFIVLQATVDMDM
jgi:hypothetical protein